MDLLKLKQSFTDAFGGSTEALCLFYAPGRVNLIGEHTDYNGGYVFPCALSLGTYGAARKRADNRIRLASGNIDLAVDVTLDELVYDPSHGWANYPKGVVAEIIKLGYALGGFDMYIWGDIPNGAGLSSSASIELLTCVAVDALFECGIDRIEMIKLSQRAENQFVGVNCGIMDQYAVGVGKEGYAVLLHCGKLEHQYVPLRMDGCKLVISNTNKIRGLSDSKYNERRSECERALALLQPVCLTEHLCDITPEQFERYAHVIEDGVIRERAAHAVYENARTLAAVDALNAGDIVRFGQLMNESHVSLRDLYAVTGAELDALAEAAWQVDGVLGSRMTGAGFGGCTVSLVRADAVPRFIDEVGRAYQARTGLTASFYMAETGQGAGVVN